MTPVEADLAQANTVDFASLLGVIDTQMNELRRTHAVLTDEAAGLRKELARANDELERSRRLAAVGEMAAGIAHEVRNPLASIRLYASMLEDDLGDRPDEQGIASKILRAVRGLDAVVNDVLLFSREICAKPAPFEVDALFDRVIDECRVQIKAAKVKVEIQNEIGADCVGDSDLLHRAMGNIVRNAVEAMADHDERMHTRVLRVVARSECGGEGEASWVLSVSDSGPGLPDGIIDRMFNPFFTTRNVGTGLGLSIVNRIAEAHGGLVRATNRPASGDDPGGATFELVIPASQDASGFEQEARAA